MSYLNWVIEDSEQSFKNCKEDLHKPDRLACRIWCYVSRWGREWWGRRPPGGRACAPSRPLASRSCLPLSLCWASNMPEAASFSPSGTHITSHYITYYTLPYTITTPIWSVCCCYCCRCLQSCWCKLLPSLDLLASTLHASHPPCHLRHKLALNRFVEPRCA